MIIDGLLIIEDFWMYFSTFVSISMRRQEEMDRFFPEEENMESMIWRGLFYTMLGLGALATTVAVVRWTTSRNYI